MECSFNKKGNTMADEKRPTRTQIMTLKEVAKYLGVHSMTVYRLLKEKKLPGFKVGGQWRTKKEVLDNYLLKEIGEKKK